MKALKSSVSVLSLLLLCSCAKLPPAPVEINVRPAQICKDYRDNEVRAEAMYRGKTITVKGKARGIVKAESPLDHGGFSLEVDGAVIFYSASQDSELYDIQKGKTYTVRGEILDIGIALYAPCQITLTRGYIK